MFGFVRYELNSDLSTLKKYAIAYNNKGQITDLNSLWKQGIYMTSQTATGVNYWGILVVYSNVGDKTSLTVDDWIFQVWYSINGTIKTRRNINNSGWTDWTDDYNGLKKSVADGKKTLAASISKYVTTASDAAFSTLNTNMNSAFDMIYKSGVSAGGSGKHTLSSQTQSKTYSYTGGEYGDEYVTLTFTKNVAGVLSYTNNQSAAYLFPVGISVYNNTVTFRMGHYHGTSHIGTSATLSVTAYVMD